MRPGGRAVRIRPARADEAAALTALVLRSKAYWGYDEAFLAACRDELRIGAGEVAARRIVVAEDGREVLGVASLEGTAPDGELGLLFVEPHAIGSGVGRALYAHVLAMARESGFTRLTIVADPNAEPFYRAVGARPVGSASSGSPAGRGLPLLEVTLEPAPTGWAQAWTGGRRAIHLGNVTGFQAQFGGLTEHSRRGGAHYACLSAFASPHPAVLVLPKAVPEGWTALVGRQLAWEPVEVFDGLEPDDASSRGIFPRGASPGGGDGLVAAVLARPALAAHLRASGLPLVPWGHTPAFAELAGEEPLAPEAVRYESKRAAGELFARLAPGHPGVRVPEQWPAATRGEAGRLLWARSRAGQATVVKTEHGVGGSGTWLVRGGWDRLVLPRGPLLLEEYIEHGAGYATGEGTPRDLTYDGLVTAGGEVHDVGVAVMEVEGTAYQGATVGPGLVPGPVAGTVSRFGHAVGRELADAGYRGWFDVDFVTGADGRPAPTEINLRLTGPAVAFMVKARLDEIRGTGHLVRTVDRIPLGARLPVRELNGLLRELTLRCAGIDAVLVPSIPTAAFDPWPYVGVVLAAHTLERLDAAEALVRTAARDVGRMFSR